MKISRNKNLRWAVLALLIVWAGVASAAVSKREALAQDRVTKYWSMRQESRMESCHAMLTKESQEKYPIGRYSKMSNVLVLEVKSVQVMLDEADKNHVIADVDYKGNVLGQVFESIKVKQNWYYENGNWFLKYEVPNPFQQSIPVPGVNTSPTEGEQAPPPAPTRPPRR